MPKKKVAIAISEWLLCELDSAARDAEASRSALVEEAVADYIVRRRSATAQKAFLADASVALEDMQRFADDVDGDPVASLEPPSLEKLRSLRAVGRGVGE
jgi:predicted transcriptional regulator